MSTFVIILILVIGFVIGGATILLSTAKKPTIKNPDKLNRNWDDDDRNDDWK